MASRILSEDCPAARKVGVIVNDMELYSEPNIRNEMAEWIDRSAALITWPRCNRTSWWKCAILFI